MTKPCSLIRKNFDGAALNADNIQVTEEEIQKAYSQVDSSLLNVIRKSLKNIESYHAKQMQYSWFDSKPDGTILGQKVTPLQRLVCMYREERLFIRLLF